MDNDDVLITRARALARESTSVEITLRERALVAVIGPQQFGFSIERISRVTRLGRCTPVPHAASLIVGVAKLEGAITAVFGGRSWRGLPEQARPDRPVLLLGAKATALALLVDAVATTIDVPDPIPSHGQSGDTWLRGIVDGVLLVDVDRLIEQLTSMGSPPAEREHR